LFYLPGKDRKNAQEFREMRAVILWLKKFGDEGMSKAVRR
jgi:hypothetical protein